MNPEQLGIACNDPEILRQNILISEISTVTSLIEPDTYEQGAVTPYPKVHRPTVKDLQPFLATEDTPVNGLIEITLISKALRRHVYNTMPLQPTICPPNQLTTTQNTKNNNLRPGLHVDSMEDLPLGTRSRSERRIGLNRGPGLRFLLIGSVSIFDIAQFSQRSSDYRPNTLDVRGYANLSCAGEAPPLRCLWIPLKPGMAYIAPTENIVHDGSTYGNRLGSTINFWVGAPKRRGELGAYW